MLTVAYMTNRRDCRIQWFFDSLFNQWDADRIPIKLVVIDFFADEPGRKEEFLQKAAKFTALGIELAHCTPMPSVWQGPHRLTQRDYFAASNSRNTALCLAPDGWIAYADDLSVLLPGWLSRVRIAMAENYVVFGSYEKVKELVVKDGEVVTFTRDPAGADHRIVVAEKMHAHAQSLPEVYPCGGSWCFGCSLALPVDALLRINAWDTDLDGKGYEDTACGHMLEKAGFTLKFDPKMKTYESWELHFVEPAFLRIDKPHVLGHRDASNAYVAMLKGGRNRAPNYFGDGGIAEVRQRVLRGEHFPVIQCPDRDWADGQLLSEM